MAAAIDIARRELAERPEVDATEHALLRSLLGRDGTVEELTRILADAIASGHLNAGTPGLMDLLWQVTLAKMAVDQPSFALYRRLTGSDDRSVQP